MTMLAEVVDAVIGTGTHRDTHEVEIADAAGKPITTMRIGNDSAGFAQLLAAVAEVAPGPGWRCRSRAPAATVRGSPREGQVRPDRRPPGGAGRAALGHQPACGAARRR